MLTIHILVIVISIHEGKKKKQQRERERRGLVIMIFFNVMKTELIFKAHSIMTNIIKYWVMNRFKGFHHHK